MLIRKLPTEDKTDLSVEGLFFSVTLDYITSLLRLFSKTQTSQRKPNGKMSQTLNKNMM